MRTDQNTGIGASIALSIFSGADASRAAGTPLYYGACQTLIIPCYVLVAWKLGWTLAPADDPFCKVLTTSYQHLADGTDAGVAGAAHAEANHGVHTLSEAALAGAVLGSEHASEPIGYVPPSEQNGKADVETTDESNSDPPDAHQR